jgi:peptidoglycan L-alanyl-D-glutamate endopeptidase CwlK
MAFELSQRDHDRLVGVHPLMIKVVLGAASISPLTFMVLEGVRSDEQCYINFGKGRTLHECEAGACPPKYSQPHLPKVTWVNHALSSNHRKKPDGYGYAVDLLPEPYDWKDLSHFDALQQAMFKSAAKLHLHIRWGADWDEDGHPRERGETDNPHFELRL